MGRRVNGRDRRHTRGEVAARTARLWNRSIVAPETMPPADVPPEWAEPAPVELAMAEAPGGCGEPICGAPHGCQRPKCRVRRGAAP